MLLTGVKSCISLKRMMRYSSQQGESMPITKKKRITSKTDPSTSEQSSSMLPEQQEFHLYLRTLA